MFSSQIFHKATFIGLILIAFLVSFSVSASSDLALFAEGLNGPFGMAFDPAGNLFVANEWSDSAGTGIAKIDSVGTVSHFAKGLDGASGLAFNSLGFLHVSDDSNRIFEVSSSGALTELTDITDLENPNAIAFDQDDNLYIANANGGFISKFNASLSTLELHFSSDLNGPQAVVVDDSEDVIYTSEMDGDVYRIDMISGVKNLYARTFAYTQGGLAMDGSGNLYLSAFDHGYVLRIDAIDKTVTTCLSGLDHPRGLAFDSAWPLYITYFETGEIFKATECGTGEPDPPPPTSHFSARPEDDRVEGWDWWPNATITVTADGSPNFTTTSDEWGYFNLDLTGFNLTSGQTVTVTDGSATKTHVVTYLAVTAIDPSFDTVSGTAFVGSDVQVWICWENGCAHRYEIADGSGGWTADFSVPGDQDGEENIFDIQPGTSGDAGQWDEDGDNTQIWWRVPNPRFSIWALNDSANGSDWSPGAIISINIDDPGAGPDYSTSTSADEWGDFDINIGDEFDIQPGFTVIVSDGIRVKDHLVTSLEITGLNPSTDIVTGFGDTGIVYVWICWEEDCATREETVVGGTWSADFRVVGEDDFEQQTYDFQPGEGVDAGQWDVDNDNTRANYQIPNPRFSARPEDDYVEGSEWLPNDSVNVSVGIFSGDADTDEWGNFNLDLSGFDLQPGQYVSVTDGISTKYHTVTNFTIDNVDHVNDIVSGTAVSGTEVLVWLHRGCDESLHVDTLGSGIWTANFMDICEIVPGTEGGAVQEDDDWDNTYIGWRAPNEPMVRVNQSHDWVDGQTPLPNTWVDISVTDASSVPKGSYADWSGGDGWFGGWCAIDNEGHCVDIVSGDIVEVDVEGTIITIPVIEMTGMVDANTDSISGWIEVEYEAPVQGNPQDGTSVSGETNTVGNYTINFLDEVLTGHNVELWYIRPDGNQVGISKSALQLSIDISNEYINGNTATDATVSITVSDTGVTKGTATTSADGEGRFGSEIYYNGERVDILPGDTVEARTSDQTPTEQIAIVDVPDPFRADMDSLADTVYGKGPAGANLWVDVDSKGGQWAFVDSSGDWVADFSDHGGLEDDDQGQVTYYTNEGHEVRLRFYGQFLQVRVNQSHNWVDGWTTPGSDIDVAVVRGGDEVMSGTTDNGGESGWYIDFCCGDDYDIHVNDIVVVTTSRDLTTSIDVIPMTGVVDANSNSISGWILGVDYPAQVRGNPQDGQQVEGETDDYGEYIINFIDPILTGHNVELWYIRPDGHQVGISKSALRLSIDISDEYISGDTASDAEVNLTLSNSGPKGTATTSADGEGRFGSEIYYNGVRMDILPGDTVEARTSNQTPTEQITIVDVPDPFWAELDSLGDTVFGKGPTETWLWVDVDGKGGKWAFVDSNGDWNADFIDEGLEVYDQGQVTHYTPEGHEVRLRFYGEFLFVRVNQSHNWVGGQTTPGSTIVATLWRDSLPIAANWTNNGSGTDWQIDLRFDDEGLQIGDIIEVETSRGMTATVEVIPIEGSVDTVEDRVSGQLLGVPFPAAILVEVWNEDGYSVESQTDVNGNYEISLDPFDLLPGNMVFIAFVQPEDGHQVGIIRHALRLDVDTRSDTVSGNTNANTPVSVTLNGGETASTTSDEKGQFNVEFSGDIAVGDTVSAVAGTQVVTLDVEDVTASIDDATDKVYGYAPASFSDWNNLNISINDDWRPARTDSSGYFEIYYDWDITPDDRLVIEYSYPEGHQARYGFGPSDVSVGKWAPIWNVAPGEEFIYIINFNNDWSGTANNVQIIDTLPEGVTYVSHPEDLDPDYDSGSNTLTWDIGTLGGESGKEIELHVQVGGSVPWNTQLYNYIEISADNDRDPGNNSSQTSVNVRPPGADFWVQKELISGQAIPGGVITYHVRFGNQGNQADPAILTDSLPSGTAFIGSTFEVGVDGLSETVNNGEVIWDLGTLQPSGYEGIEFEFSVQISDSITSGTFLTNELTITPDPGPWGDNRDNRRILNTIVEPEGVDLWVDKVIEGDLSSMDDEILYRITFRNDGNSPATDVTVIDTLPSGMTHVWHSAGSVVVGADGTITWNLGTVPPDTGGELLIGAELDSSVLEGTVLTNSVVITTISTDLDPNNNHAEAELGPPRAIAVPWVGTDPHRVWSGLETTLKGVAKGYGLTHYTWDFGDGSPVVSGSIDDPYAIEAKHKYMGDVGDIFTATLTITGAFGWFDSDEYYVGIFNQVHGVEKDVAIDESLWYLHKSAERYREGGLSFAVWSQGGNRAAEIATAVQAFQIHGHGPGGNPMEDPYVEDARSGWNALLTYAVLDPMLLQNSNDPDFNGNGVGIGMYENYGHSIYESGLAMMALASSGTRDEVARTGPFVYVRGRKYVEIAQDMADWFAWGQNDAGSSGEDDWARGGWRYQPNSGDSDNSNVQFPVLGLAAAEDNWGITVPQFVKDELRDYWLAYSQYLNDEDPEDPEDGAFGYAGPWGMHNVSKTGAGIMDLIWAGVLVDDDRVTRAADYIERHWEDDPDPQDYVGNVGDFYAMYAVKKGSQFAGILNYGLHPWDYEYSSYLIDVQSPDGHFDEDPTLGWWFGNWQPMSTSWALLILSEGLYEALPVAIISDIPSCLPGPTQSEPVNVEFDGTLSYHIDPTVSLDTYKWTFDDGETASGDFPIVPIFHDYYAIGQYLVTLKVTDVNSLYDTDTMLLYIGNVAPKLGPISVSDNLVEVNVEPVDAWAIFRDPCVLEPHEAVWDWGDESTDTQPEVTSPVSESHIYTEPGVYRIQLKVTDSEGELDTSEYMYIVVYDPEGSFVTGGGWIYSEAGSYLPDDTLEGMANFGFVSKYQRGANVPTGQTEFQFHVADLNFHSDIYDWLVVAGAKAKFKGTGTINGEGEYKFMLTAIDADINENDSFEIDRFRIKIWYEDGNGDEIVIYDNGLGGDDDDDNATTKIGGGSIVIHTKK